MTFGNARPAPDRRPPAAAMIITISGQSGSGKTTVANGLGRRLGMPAVDVGSLFREMAAERGQDVIEFGAYAQKHPEIDRELDRKMIELCRRRRNLILQGRLAGWMTKRGGIEAYRVWITATDETRARRIAEREKIPFEQAYADTRRRDADNHCRYQQTYGLDLNDLSIYDTVIRTDNLTVEEVVSALISEIQKVWPKKRKSKTSRRPKPPLKRRRRPANRAN